MNRKILLTVLIPVLILGSIGLVSQLFYTTDNNREASAQPLNTSFVYYEPPPNFEDIPRRQRTAGSTDEFITPDGKQRIKVVIDREKSLPLTHKFLHQYADREPRIEITSETENITLGGKRFLKTILNIDGRDAEVDRAFYWTTVKANITYPPDRQILKERLVKFEFTQVASENLSGLNSFEKSLNNMRIKS